MRLFAAVVAGAALVLCGCASSKAPVAARGVVSGTVLAGPVCPVERADSPCPPVPVVGAPVLARVGGHTQARTVTDDKGGFRLNLQPGMYTIVATNVGAYASTAEASVLVRAAETATITLTVDTGIR